MARYAWAFALVAACTTTQAPPALDHATPTSGTSATVAGPASAVSPAAAATSASPTPSAVPVPSASASAPAGAAGTASANAGPPPKVRVANIGMHIGGGPNDDATKAPIRRSVEPHMSEFQRCFALADPAREGDFGVDLRIPRDGGKAEVSHPRTAIKGADFKRCVVETFERVDFEKPKGGTTVVSYSLRFTPER